VKTGNESTIKESRELIPLDLTDWVEPAILMSWVWTEIETLDWANAELQKYLNQNPGYKPKEMLTLLTFAYSTKVFESDRVADLAGNRNPIFSYFSGLTIVPEAVVRFRRDNRGLLKSMLIQVFKRALQYRFQLPSSDIIPAGLKQHLLEAGGERIDLARHLDRASQH
jgi:hypothetical protein